MTSSRQLDDHEGTFGDWQLAPQRCNRPIWVEMCLRPQQPCGASVRFRLWESSDGAYEDYQYRCSNGHTWWVDGIDS